MLEASTMRSDDSADKDLYRKEFSAKEIVREGKVPTPRLRQAISRASAENISEARVLSRDRNEFPYAILR